VSASPIRDGLAEVRIEGTHGLLDVTVRVEGIAADGLTCANPGPNRYLRFRPVSIDAVD